MQDTVKTLSSEMICLVLRRQADSCGRLARSFGDLAKEARPEGGKAANRRLESTYLVRQDELLNVIREINVEEAGVNLMGRMNRDEVVAGGWLALSDWNRHSDPVLGAVRREAV